MRDRVGDVADERADEHRPCLVEGDAPAAQVEECIVVEAADGGSVGAAHVVGQDLQPWSGVGFCVRAEDQVPVGLMGVGGDGLWLSESVGAIPLPHQLRAALAEHLARSVADADELPSNEANQ